MRGKLLEVGDPAPWFVTRSTANERYHFDAAAGRLVVLAFIESAGRADSRAFLARIVERRAAFDDEHASFFGLSVDAADESQGRLRQSLPGLRHLWDTSRVVSTAYGAHRVDNGRAVGPYRRHVLVLDPRLAVAAVVMLGGDPVVEADRVVEHVMALRAEADDASRQAPVLLLPRVFEPELCERLVAHFDETGGADSGFMQERNGRTVASADPSVKRRRDRLIDDGELRQACLARLRDRVMPEIAKAFQFRATRIERYVISRYSAEDHGFFRRHRDNTTAGTAHRRFAVSLNLNTGAYRGGELVFPEFTPRRYRPTLGGACVFSCSLLHEATAVTEGVRYAFLPFLYDDAGAEIRRKNQASVDLAG